MNSKALLLFIAFCFLFNESFAQNKLDASGRKSGKWVFKGKDHPSSNYADNSIVEEGNFINGRKEGIWLRYHKDGKTPKLKGNYRNNRPEGFYIRYHRNSKKMEEATFIQNKYKGNCIRRTPTGHIKNPYYGRYDFRNLCTHHACAVRCVIKQVTPVQTGAAHWRDSGCTWRHPANAYKSGQQQQRSK